MLRLIGFFFVFSLLFSHQAQAGISPWNYRTDCWVSNSTKIAKSVGSGRFKIKISVTIPPDPWIYSACLTVKSADVFLRNFWYKNGVYGNFCGTGWRKPDGRWDPDGNKPHIGVAIDSLDAACMRHDQCYDSDYKLSPRCDCPMNQSACAECSRQVTKTRLAELSGTLCTAWTSIISPLVIIIRPLSGIYAMVIKARGQ